MARIGFLGLGNMGGPMAANLLKAGHEVRGFDPVPAARERFAAAGGTAVESAAEAVRTAEVVISMLPEGRHVRAAYLEPGGVLELAPAGALLIDCSTIDVATARAVAGAAKERGLAMVDAPVSGGVAGATAGTLTFMVGGEPEAFARAKPILEAMGRAVIHAGPSGNGQAAKICNNLMLGIQMISVCEAMALAEKLGLSHQTLFDISSKSSGQCWSLTNYCPVPGPVPTSPANRGYQPGFTVAMMRKDLKLAVEAALATGARTPLGAQAYQLYNLFASEATEGLDFSAIMTMISGQSH
ncbi:MAG: 3-hydroxyisobutyrate dehydrogenase [Geminicoccaceae bacterium]|nr:3-hydroxyisobutyrate dehydrogenase [Geminicoccaceae bacterium]MCS7267124.1 3-hydroxyisobutyrate dehydrogenase [Geminicoccaceae bacterium]MDW8125709.1 3-hydroxyisobutyrate dehydrogenase [Geminicoccaceae bacterium]MDW8341704.1 3-hydroxyisobutyrate dehydrogenase [Geminicoccaceae bacterium]